MCPTQTEKNAFLVMDCQPVRDTEYAIDIFDAGRQTLQIFPVQQRIRFRLDVIGKPDRIAAEFNGWTALQLVQYSGLCRCGRHHFRGCGD